MRHCGASWSRCGLVAERLSSSASFVCVFVNGGIGSTAAEQLSGPIKENERYDGGGLSSIVIQTSWRLVSDITCVFACQGSSQGFIFNEGIIFFCDRYQNIIKKKGFTWSLSVEPSVTGL